MKLPPNDIIANNLYEAAARSRSTQQHRNYLGMSAIGDPCERKLWFSFRGFTSLPLEGRSIMIFRVGDIIESEIVEWLKAAGYQVDGQQDAFSDHDRWFSGHCDGIIHGITQHPHILEIKSAKDKKFKAFKGFGVQKTYQTYWDQVQCYMGYSELDCALFVIQNKDTSEIYTERVHFKAEAFEILRTKALRIITANKPPDFQESFYCTWCDYRNTCRHPEESIQALQDCMTCKYLKWNGLKRYCQYPQHSYEIRQRSGVCPEWTEPHWK